MRIFGREPAMWLAFIAALVKLISAFWLHLTVDQQSTINALAAAVVGVVVAVLVHDGLSAAILGLSQGSLALAIGFGLHMAADKQAILMAAVGITVAMFVRTQVTAPAPAVTPAPAASQGD